MSRMTIPPAFAAVERKTGFKFPKSYLGLVSSGATRYGKSRAHWQKHWQEIAFASPPALLCSHPLNVEWMKPSEIKAWKPADWWDEELQLVAFAENGYGGSWCWCLDYEDKHGTPIALLERDVKEAQLFAADFPAFLFRSFVESLLNVEDETIAQFGDLKDYRRFLDANLRTIRPALRRGWAKRLADVLSRPAPNARDKKVHSFIDAKTHRALLKEYIYRGQVDYWFPLVANHTIKSQSALPDELADVMALAENWAMGEWYYGLEDRFAKATAEELDRIRNVGRLAPVIRQWLTDNMTESYCETSRRLAAMQNIAGRLERYEESTSRG